MPAPYSEDLRRKAVESSDLLAPMTFEGGCNRLCFEVWLEHNLLPKLSPGKTLILDNASFHQGGRIKALVEAAGCRLLYLPPYSPDFNRIEQLWSPLKHRTRRLIPHCSSLREAMEDAFNRV